MNNLIRVEDAKLYLAKNYIDGNKSLGQCLDEVPTVNAIEIPDNVTNGDVIKALFGKDISNECIDYLCKIMKCGEWWNAPYKAESEE